MIHSSRQALTLTRENLNKKPVDCAKTIIDFLNSLSEDDLKKANVKDIISNMTQATKVIKKYHHLDTVQEKVDILAHQVKLFIDMFDPLFKKWIPFLWKEKDAMLTQNEYHEMLIACKQDHANFANMNQLLSRKIIVDKLADEFEILFTFKEACVHLQRYSYKDHIKLHMLEKEMSIMELPSPYQYKTVERFERTKYILHTQA